LPSTLCEVKTIKIFIVSLRSLRGMPEGASPGGTREIDIPGEALAAFTERV